MTTATDTEPYQYCYECGQEYATERDLIDAYNAEISPGCPPATAGNAVFSCPACLHDFLYPPTTDDASSDDDDHEARDHAANNDEPDAPVLSSEIWDAFTPDDGHDNCYGYHAKGGEYVDCDGHPL